MRSFRFRRYWSPLRCAAVVVLAYFLFLWFKRKTLWPKQTEEETVYWASISMSESTMKEVKVGRQVKNLEARTEAEAMEKWGSPACSGLPSTTRDCGQKVAAAQWTGPSHVNHEPRKCPRGLHPHQSGGGICSARVLSSQMIWACVDKKPRQYNSLFWSSKLANRRES